MFRLNSLIRVLNSSWERKKDKCSCLVIEQLRLLSVKTWTSAGPTESKKSVGAKSDHTRHANLSSKQVLRRIFNLVRTKLGSSEFDVKYSTESIVAGGFKSNGTDHKWKTRLSINWPRDVVFEGTGRKKVEAETNAAAVAFRNLKESGVVDDDYEPVFSNAQPKNEEQPDFGHPKVRLENAFQIVRRHLDATHKLNYQSKMIKDRRFFSWETTLTLTWPKPLTVTAIGLRKKDSESGAALKALQHLREVGVLNDDNNPLINTEHEIQEFLSGQRSVPRFQVDEGLLKQMNKVVEDIRNLNLCSNWTSSSASISTLPKSVDTDDDFVGHDSTNCDVFVGEGSFSQNEPILDIFSGRPLSIPRERTLELRNLQLLNNSAHLRDNSGYAEAKNRLPITSRRREILELIQRHPVVVIVGDTGCGKTTQLPQFILDDFSERMEGSSCNMVVTQPRRIGAISVARRVAEERGESLGDTVGYRVRLDGVVPSKHGRILFCSTGDFIRRLLNNSGLTGVSHVLLDEVHERDVQIDFLLILLRDLVRRRINPELRIVVMSATLDYKRLASYFDDCPICHVEGLLHPVLEHFRDDLGDLMHRTTTNKDNEQFSFDANDVAALIQNVSASRPPNGAILCFLPGWQEIKTIRRILTGKLSNEAASWVLPVHSKLSQKEQSRIFDRPPPSIRKIILATNIAEASITVDDVVYVIDCGIHREMNYNSKRGVSCLETVPISLANVKQRRGRAGRTRPGECFHLFPKEVLQVMTEFPTPEMQRTSLETIVLNAKAYFPDFKAEYLLAKALDPPPINAITAAVRELKDLDILDEDERLTPLGRLVLPFTAHPRLAKAIVYAAAFRCADSVLSLAAIQSGNRDIFLHSHDDTLDLKKEVKRRFCKADENSDHLISVNVFDAWLETKEMRGSGSATEFCNTHCLNGDALYFAKGIKDQLKRQLHQTVTFVSETSNDCRDSTLIKSILAAAFYPNVIQLKKGSIRKSRIVRDSTTYVKPNGAPVALLGDSVNRTSPSVDVPWLTYFTSVHSAQRRREVVRETSAVPLVALLLFAGRTLSIRMVPGKIEYFEEAANGIDERDEDGEVFLAVDDSRVLRCRCSMRTAKSLIDLRMSMEVYLRWLFTNPPKDTTESLDWMAHLHLVDTLVRLLNGRPSDT